MPAPLTHAVYGLIYLQQRPELDRTAFIRGTIFPDIRRLTGLPREQTHRFDVVAAQVDHESDAWQAGWLLHSYLDVVWNKELDRLASEMNRPVAAEARLALKIVEETKLFSRMAEFGDVGAVFSVPDAHELAVAGREVAAAWDDWVRWKLTRPFEAEEWARRAQVIGFAAEEVAKILPVVAEMSSDPFYHELLHRLHVLFGIEAVASEFD